MSETPARRDDGQAPRWVRRGLLVAGAAALLIVLYLAMRPAAVPVDLVPVTRGDLDVVVEEDGQTRVRDRYGVTAPVAGTLRRIALEPGDSVAAGDVLAVVERPASALPDARTDARTRARLEAARASVERFLALAEAAEAAIVEARELVRRHEVLLAEGGSTRSDLERAQAGLRAREAEARSARFAVEVAEGEAEDLRRALDPDGGALGGAPGGAPLEVRSPVTGVVLRVQREDAGSVAPGEPLLEVGDPSALEVVVDLLSADAVRVPPGAEARIVRWGGSDQLAARVRRVEPAGFTRTSALGIEEQRVNVLLVPDGGAGWAALGDGFRVEARILLERAENVLRVSTGALAREGERWVTFRANGRRLERVTVEVGVRNESEAQVLGGLDEGDLVVAYPADRVVDGARYRRR